MGALYYLAPQFLEENRLCWLRSPLYIVKNGKEESYYFNDDEFNTVRGSIKGEVQRNKGLGALSPEQAHKSMFTEEYQRMDVLKPTADAIQLLTELMGDDVSYRTEYIFKNIDFNTIHE
jgi:DNA gyrase/topoisomerase IV subunit B